jgi:hypothetical protein
MRHTCFNNSQERKMKLTQKSGATIAMTAAALIISGATLIAAASADTVKGQCFGVNGCKGQGACKSAKNDCKGKNACKGQGFLSMSEEDCNGQNGQFQKS